MHKCSNGSSIRHQASSAGEALAPPDENEFGERDEEKHQCYTCVTEKEYESVGELFEQGVVLAFLVSGTDVGDSQVAGSISECGHDELAAFYSLERARSFGAMVDKRVHSYRPKGEVNTGERRKGVHKAKSSSNCRSCGQRGHWSGDQECPSKGGEGGHDEGSGKGAKPSSRISAAMALPPQVAEAARAVRKRGRCTSASSATPPTTMAAMTASQCEATTKIMDDLGFDWPHIDNAIGQSRRRRELH